MKAKIKLNNYQFNNINISGSKNSSLPIIAGSILCDEEVVLHNIPNILDVNTLINILKKINCNVNFFNNTLTVKPSNLNLKKIDFNEVKKLRGSYYLLGALIGKFEYSDFNFVLPGGCNLGNRPINFHISAFKKMQLVVKKKGKKIHIKGNKINTIHKLPFPSVGTTINIILAASKIEKETIIINAAIEPEVIDVCNFLISMGANIIIKNRIIKIIGCNYFKKSTYRIMEDRIEAGTFLILGALHQGIKINNINPNNIYPLTSLLSSIGYELNICDNSIEIHNNGLIKPFNIILEPHPGIPTDLGPILCVLASQINGKSIIIEKVFTKRTSHIKQLKKLNIDITNINNITIINGKGKIKENNINAKDLRCSAALLLAATLSYSYSIINDIDKLFRGYEDIQRKLNDLGIDFIIC